MKTSIDHSSPTFMLARNLRVLIAERRESASSVARRAGISRKTLQNWTSGQMLQSVTKLYRLSLILQVSLEQLCFGEPGDFRESPARHSEDMCEVVLTVPVSAIRAARGLPVGLR